MVGLEEDTEIELFNIPRAKEFLYGYRFKNPGHKDLMETFFSNFCMRNKTSIFYERILNGRLVPDETSGHIIPFAKDNLNQKGLYIKETKLFIPYIALIGFEILEGKYKNKPCFISTNQKD